MIDLNSLSNWKNPISTSPLPHECVVIHINDFLVDFLQFSTFQQNSQFNIQAKFIYQRFRLTASQSPHNNCPPTNH